jgi:hypothetical protein
MEADGLPIRKDAGAARTARGPEGQIPPYREGRGQVAAGGAVGDFGPSKTTQASSPFKNLSSKG